MRKKRRRSPRLQGKVEIEQLFAVQPLVAADSGYKIVSSFGGEVAGTAGSDVAEIGRVGAVGVNRGQL